VVQMVREAVSSTRMDRADDVGTFSVGPVVQACKECRDGKHDNCNGDTWDEQTDDFAPCPCAAMGHAGTGR
jgi:hypothetical protein